MTTAIAPGTQVDRSPASDAVRVWLTDRPEDIDLALRVVHDAFVEAGFMAPQPSGRRMIGPYLNPGTVWALAWADLRPAGANALISDGPFGLPSDRAFAEELDALRARGPLFEVGSLALASAARRHHARIFPALIATLVRHVEMGVPPGSVGFTTVNPSAERFYASTLGAEVIAGPRPLYGAPAIAVSLDPVVIRERLLAPSTSSQRRLAQLVYGPRGSWHSDRLTGEPLPSEWSLPLVQEQGVGGRLAAQVDLVLGRLGWHTPASPLLQPLAMPA